MNTILEETPTKTRLGVGFDAQGGHSDAWKRSIGTTKVPARLEMLPEGESRLNRVGASAMVQIVLLTFFVALPRLLSGKIEHHPEHGIYTSGDAGDRSAGGATAAPAKDPESGSEARGSGAGEAESQAAAHLRAAKSAAAKNREGRSESAGTGGDTIFESKIDTQTNQPKRPKEEVKVNN